MLVPRLPLDRDPITRIRALPLLIAIALFVPGCSDSDRVCVHGQVTLDGQPVDKGAIRFVPIGDTKGALAGGFIADGEYYIKAADGPVIGRYKVELNWTKKTGRQVREPPPAPPGKMMEEVMEGIPAWYNTRSTLTAELKPGKNKLDFQLKSRRDLVQPE
jgi:hypothetical protein